MSYCSIVPRHTAARAQVWWLVTLLVAIHACGREPTGPGIDDGRGGFALALRVADSRDAPNAVNLLPPFERVSISLADAAGSIVVTQSMAVPAGGDSVTLDLTVPLPRNAPAAGVPMSIRVALLDASGASVCTGGPAPVMVLPGRRAPPVVILLTCVTVLPPPVTNAVRLVVSSLGSVLTAGAPLAPEVLVRAVDSLGNTVASFAGDVTLALTGGASGASLIGTRTVPAVSGVARFTGLSVEKAGTGYGLAASGGGLSGTSPSSFSVVPAAASALRVLGGNGQSGLVGTLLGGALSVLVSDAYGNAVPGAPVVWAVTSGGGLLGSNTTQSGADGVATNHWTLGPLPGLQGATASLPGASGAVAAFSATAALAEAIAKVLAISPVPSSVVAGLPLGDITVRALDDAGQVVTTFTQTVTIALSGGQATLNGTHSVAAQGGVARFGDLNITRAAGGYGLIASAANVSSATSNTFSITNAVARTLAVAGGSGQSGVIGTLLPAPLAVKITDAFGNAVPGVAVTWQVLSGLGSLASGTTQTDASGIASNRWTLGLLPALQSVSASAGGLAGSPATFTGTGILGTAGTRLAHRGS